MNNLKIIMCDIMNIYLYLDQLRKLIVRILFLWSYCSPYKQLNNFFIKTTWRRGPWRESWRVYWGVWPVLPPTAPYSRCLLTSYPPTWLQTSCLPCQTLFSLSLITYHHCWCSLTEVCRLLLSIFSEGKLPTSLKNFIKM